MINEENVQGQHGMPIVWVIDNECLYDLPVAPQYISMFTEFDEVVDVSNEYPEHNGLTVRFIKNGNTVEDFQTSEYFGSILLSEPTWLDLTKYPCGHFVESPHATFNGEKFIITNRDITALPEWHPKNPNTPEGYFDQFN